MSFDTNIFKTIIKHCFIIYNYRLLSYEIRRYYSQAIANVIFRTNLQSNPFTHCLIIAQTVKGDSFI